MPEKLLQISALDLARGGRAIFAGADFALDGGEAVVLLGASGSGKSSLLALILGEIPPDRGAIALDGVPVAGLDAAGRALLRRRVGLAGQTDRLLPAATVFENVALPLEIAGFSSEKISARVGEILEKVGLDARASDRVENLSGGERRRVSLARAFVAEPRLILLDEPTASLDPAARDGIIEILRDFHAAGAPILVTTHDAAVADAISKFPRGRAMKISDGKIIAA